MALQVALTNAGVFMDSTQQMKQWEGGFGTDYTERNKVTLEQLDAAYAKQFGVTRTQLNQEFLAGINKDAKILEVGCNVGNQLANLQKLGFNDLWGLEISEYALEIAKKQYARLNVVHSSAFDIPFKDNFFDLVFTSGVLIHISPNDLPKAIDEIYRASRKYVWGYEYFAEKCEQINYRGNQDLLWKNNFAKSYLERHSNLKLLKEKKLKYSDSENIDSMFLLSK